MDFLPVLMYGSSGRYALEVAAESTAPDGIVPFSTPSLNSSSFHSSPSLVSTFLIVSSMDALICSNSASLRSNSSSSSRMSLLVLSDFVSRFCWYCCRWLLISFSNASSLVACFSRWSFLLANFCLYFCRIVGRTLFDSLGGDGEKVTLLVVSSFVVFCSSTWQSGGTIASKDWFNVGFGLI